KYTYVSYSKDFPVVWLHTETDRDPQSPKNIERMKRNQRILEAQLEDERKTKEGADPRTLLYLMKIYIELNDKNLYLKTLNMGQEYLQKSGWDEERALCLQIMSKAYEMLGDIKKAITHALASINEYPYSSLTYLYLAKYYIEDNNFEKAEHWLDQALTIKEKEKTQMNNELEKKTLAGELALKINFTHKKDIRKSYKIAKYLYDLLETKETKETYQAIKDLYELDIASEGVHKLFKYLEKTKEEGKIIDIYKTLPKEIKELEFAVYYKNKYTYRKWKTDEICYYIGQHFEVWSPDSLKTGIGGSETAVIKLSNEWQKQGYQVVVYGGVIKPKVYNGVLWLPYFYFNPRDDFNIFIQWRSSSLAGKIKCKKFLVDLHDLYSPLSIDWDRIDYVMVKSQFHRNLAKHIPDYKFKIISNGV
ncbi:MAG: tetratricopeptide repeat protein, partial [Candidatus Diapherotrites archaeon]|nr:tetratricopeptide repeat protein [Candidatus Diapherotrites archaeon]